MHFIIFPKSGLPNFNTTKLVHLIRNSLTLVNGAGETLKSIDIQKYSLAALKFYLGKTRQLHIKHIRN